MKSHPGSHDIADVLADGLDPFAVIIHPDTAFTGGSGNDTLVGTASDDTFDLSAGGNDTASGLAGDDVFTMGGTLNAADKIDGGDGFDTVILNGNYANLVLKATTLVNVEDIQLGAGHNYNITTNDATVAAGQTLNVDASALGAANTLVFNGAAETDGSFSITGGAGNDTVTGGAGDDFIDASFGGDDVIVTGAGLGDEVYFGAAFTANDKVDGTGGSTLVFLSGDYSAGVTLQATTLVDVTELFLQSGVRSGTPHSYNLTLNDGNVAAGGVLTIAGPNLASSETVRIDGTAETDGQFLLYGGAGNDTLLGGAGNDFFRGGGGDDLIDGGAGRNRATYSDDVNGVNVSLLQEGHAQNTGDGNDTLKNIQDLSGGAGGDTLTGDNNSNWLWGEGGGDTIVGNGGNDLVQVGAGTGTVVTDSADGGSGNDTLSFDDNGAGSPIITFSLALQGTPQATGIDNLTAVNFENVVGSSAADGLTGDGNANILYGGAGDDVLIGGAGNDVLYGDKTYGAMGSAGGDGPLGASDVATGTGGNDILEGGAGSDTLDGGEGNNTAVYGDATGGVTVNLTIETGQAVGGGDGTDTLINIQNLQGSNFNDTLTGDGNANRIDGGAGNNHLDGGAGDDTLLIDAGSNDTVTGDAGDDVIIAGQALTAADRIDGGTGLDAIVLFGNYAGLTLAAATMVNVEGIVFLGGYSYKLTTNDATVAAGQTMIVQANTLGAGDSLNFDGSHETDGSFSFTGGAGNDTLIGGAGADTFDVSQGGNDVVTGGSGNDVIIMGAALTASDAINGGAGSDTVRLTGDYSGGVTLADTTLVGIETLTLVAGFSYTLTTANGNVAAGQTLTVDASLLGAANALSFNGAAETDGSFVINGGFGADTLTGGAGVDTINGGAGNDVIAGGGGADQLTGGVGSDTFAYAAVSDSMSTGYDTIFNFDMTADKFHLPFAVTAIDHKIGSGTLSTATFDSDLAAAVTAAKLGANHAVLFTPGAGTLSGDTFLIVDANGVAGYQAGADYVIDLNAPAHLSSLSTGDFI